MRFTGLIALLIALAMPVPAGERPSTVAADLPADLAPRRVRMRGGSRPATPDLLAALWHCPRCERANVAERLLPEQPPFDQLRDVRSLLERVALGRGGAWAPPGPGRCRTCGSSSGKKVAYKQLFFFRYLPETGCDAVARVTVRRGKSGAVRWGKLDVAGDYDAAPDLETQTQFIATFGRVLVLREVWSNVVRACIRKGEAQALKVAPGYFVSCRKRSADPDTNSRFAAELNIKLAKLGAKPTGMLRLALTESAGSPLAKVIPTYQRWMSGQRTQLEGGTYSAAAYVQPKAFWALLDREIRHTKVRLVHPAGASSPQLIAGDYRASIAAEAVLLKTVHSGLTYGEGLHHFAWPLVLQLSKMKQVGQRARDALGAYETSVSSGKFLTVREQPAAKAPPGSGKILARINVHALAGSVGLRDRASVALALRGLLGLDPKSGLIRPPDLEKERGPDGIRSWLTRKLRPKGHFKKLGIGVLTADWRGLSAAWSLDCLEYSRLLPSENPPSKQKLASRFKEDLVRSTFLVPSAKGLNWEGTEVRAAMGPDIASSMTHERLRRGLAQYLKIPQKGVEMTFWAPTTNIVLVSAQPITGQARADLKRSVTALLRSVKLQRGYEIDIEIRERLTAEPAGKFVR